MNIDSVSSQHLHLAASRMAPPTTPDKLPTAETFSDTVVVKVGAGKKQRSFTLHKGVLAFYSGYFESALKETFQEGKSGIIKLDTEDPIEFGQFVGWLYTHNVEYVNAVDDVSRFWEIFKLWIFADRRQIPLLMNMVIDDLRTFFVQSWTLPSSGELQYLYDNTTSTSQLRIFVVYLICNTNDFRWLEKQIGDSRRWPAEALRDCLVLLGKQREEKVAKRMNKTDVDTIDMCIHHVHEEGVKCVKKK